MKRQRGKFLSDLNWENKTYKAKRPIATSLFATCYFCARACVRCFLINARVPVSPLISFPMSSNKLKTWD